MAHKVTSISSDDRLLERVLAQAPNSASDELCSCFNAFRLNLQRLAKAHPGCVAIGAIATGKARSLVVFTPSCEWDHYSLEAPEQIRTLAQIVGHLDPYLRSEFENELATIPRPGA